MNSNLNTIIKYAKKLNPNEQVELITAVSKFLKGNQNKILINSDFWEPKSIEYLAKSQKYKINEDLEIDSSFWPDDESIDDFIDFINNQRKEDIRTY